MKQNKINVIIFTIIIVLMSGVCYAGSSDNGFTVGNTTLTYRTPVNMTENSGSNLTDYQILLTIDTASLISAGKMQADCDDLRFTDSDETTELSYWLEFGCNTSSTKVWVKVQEIPAGESKTIYTYYGNDDAESQSDGRNTFIIWDDFDGGTEQWTEVDATGSISFNNNELQYNTLTGKEISYVYKEVPELLSNDKYIMQFKSKTTGYLYSPYRMVGIGSSLNVLDKQDDSLYVGIFPKLNTISCRIRTNSISSDPSPTTTLTHNTDMYVRLIRNDDTLTVSVYSDNAYTTQIGAPVSITNTIDDSNMKYIYLISSQNAGYTNWITGIIDDVIVRKYASPKPTYTIGAEQSSFIYSYRKAITINNTGGSALTDYQIKIEYPIYNETGLIGSWHFDGTATDSSGNDNTGTLQGDTHYVDGRYGQALSFDGSGDYVDYGNKFSNIEIRTIEMWFKPAISYNSTTAGSVASLIFRDDSTEANEFGIAIRLADWSDSGHIFFQSDSNPSHKIISNNDSWNAGQLYHIVGIIDPTEGVSLYIDGVKQMDTDSSTAAIPKDTENIVLGRWGAYNARYFNGLIDEFRIYNRALSDDEIKAHYDAKAKPNYNDIRFTDSTSFKESEWPASYPYWQEKDGTFWVKVQEIPVGESKTIYTYYGNDEAESASDGTNTFEFFDDFSEDLSKWSVGTSTSIESGRLKLVDSSGQGFAESIQTLEGDLIAESDWWINQPTSNYDKLVFRFPINSEDQVYLMREYSAGQKAVWNAQGGGYNSIGFSDNSGSWSISHFNNEQTAIINTYNWPQTGTFSSTIPFKIKFSTHHGHTGYIDNTRIRKYTSIEPTLTIGSEQQNVAVPCTDNDGDGWGAADSNLTLCNYTASYDCNDSDADINPNAYDIPNNGIDEDCSGDDAYASYEAKVYFIGETGFSELGYYIGDDVYYEVNFMKNNISSDEDVVNIVVNLTDVWGNVLKSQSISGMAHPNTGNWTGMFTTHNIINQDDDKVNLKVYVYNSGGTLLDWRTHGDEWFVTGTIPSFISTAYTYLTDALSNHTVKDLVVNSTEAKIDWSGTKLDLHARDIDFDSALTIGDRSAYLDSAAYSELNDSATITFYNVNCASPYVFYSETVTTRLAILTENKQCLPPRCTDIQCTGSTLTVTVSSFTGYAAEADANLSIDADDPKFAGAEVHFTVDYRNVTDDSFISGAACTIYFTDGNYPMAEGADIYTYNRTFVTEGLKDYNVTCSKAGFSTLTAFDNATIVSAEIPEFSIMTLGLGLIAVLAGLFIIRKKR